MPGARSGVRWGITRRKRTVRGGTDRRSEERNRDGRRDARNGPKQSGWNRSLRRRRICRSRLSGRWQEALPGRHRKAHPRRMELHQPSEQRPAIHCGTTRHDKGQDHRRREREERQGRPTLAADGKTAARGGAQAAALTKALWDVGHVARIILDLDWLKESLSVEAEMEGDDSPQPERLQTIIAELCAFLNALVAEETGEILDDSEISSGPVAPDLQDVLVMAAGAPGATLVADLCKVGGPKMQKFAAALLAKAQHSEGDQALLDLAHHAVDKCIGMNGLLFVERSHMTKARDALEAAGAAPSEESTINTARNPEFPPPMVRPPALEFRPGENAAVDTSRRPQLAAAAGVIEMIAATLGKRGSGHQALMDVAHACIGQLTDGAFCATAKVGARHSQETLQHLAEAHDHIVAAGAKCDVAEFAPEEEWEGTDFEARKATMGNLAKLFAGERAEKAALIATL